MIAAIGSLIAGAVITRVWPWGVMFLLLFPAVLVGITLPTLPQTLARLGQPVAVTPAYIVLYYLQSVAMAAVFFFIAFAIQKWVTRDRTPKDETTEDA
jgi:hypothetical protein